MKTHLVTQQVSSESKKLVEQTVLFYANRGIQITRRKVKGYHVRVQNGIRRLDCYNNWPHCVSPSNIDMWHACRDSLTLVARAFGLTAAEVAMNEREKKKCAFQLMNVRDRVEEAIITDEWRRQISILRGDDHVSAFEVSLEQKRSLVA